MVSFRHILFAGAASVALVLFATVPASAQASPRASATVNGATINISGVAYVDARLFLSRLGFKASWIERGKTMRFQSTSSRLDLEADNRAITFNGLRVLMGEPAVFRGATFYVSRIDADKLFLPILSPSSVATPPAPALRVIVIDAGHGGQDTGTQNKPFKMDEKDFTIDVANRLRGLLVNQGYKVVMTRTDDRFIPLQQRADIANKAGADLFISIHFNAVAGSPEVRGSETYVMTPQYQRSTGNPRRDPSDNVVNPGNRNDPWNALLGYHMHDQVVGKLDSMDRGFKRARFAVLRLVNSPGVLVEAGYLSNNEEAKKIATPVYRQAIAESMAQGVQAYARAITTVKTK